MIAAASERPKRSRAKVASEAAAAAPVPRTQAKIKTEPEVAAVAADAKVSVPATPAVFSRPLLPAVKYTYDALKVLFDPMAKTEEEDIYPDPRTFAPEERKREETLANGSAFANATAPAIEEEDSAAATKEEEGENVAEDEKREATAQDPPAFPTLPTNHVMFGPLKMYRLPPMSVAGLKSLLKMDAVIGLLLGVAMIIAFAIVGDKHRALGIPLSPLTRAAVGFAISAALASLLGCLLTVLMFFRYKNPAANGLISPRLVAAKFGAAACAVFLSLMTCLLSAVSTETETSLGLLTFSSGVLSSPIYAVSFIMEFYALFVRPYLLARQGVVPMLDEDEDACCGEV